MSDKKLLPCPFCGGEARLQRWRRTYGYYVICKKCGCRTPVCQYQYDSKETRQEDAINTWNTRVPIQKIVERLEDINMTAVDLANLTCSTYQDGVVSGIERSLEIVKEEGGLND